MDNRNRRRKQIYRRRRLVAGAISLVILLGLVILIGKIFVSTGRGDKAKENNKTIMTAKDVEKRNVELEKYVETFNLNDIFDANRKRIEEAKVMWELRPTRLEIMREQSMGRGPKQSLLKKVVYLTFDDGPSSKMTDQVLDILKEHDIKATFFVIGRNVEAYPEILKRIHSEGHGIGIHTYSHDYNKIYASPDALEKDIEACLRSVRKVLGEDFTTNIYRFPGGSFRSNKDIFIKRVEDMGYVYFDWNVLNGDAEGKNPSEEYLIKRFNETSKGFNIILSLMHDTNAKTNMPNTLPEIIERLKSEGYKFKSLGETL